MGEPEKHIVIRSRIMTRAAVGKPAVILQVSECFGITKRPWLFTTPSGYDKINITFL